MGMQDHKAEEKFVERVAALLQPGRGKPTVLQRAAIFEKFVSQNRNFAGYPAMIEAANGLADALEKEISTLKASVAVDRDEKLAAARSHKKAARGFATFAYKEGILGGLADG